MTTKGLLVRLKAKPGRTGEVEELLCSGLALVREEPATSAWFAVRFGRSSLGIFDAFPGEEGRRAHLADPLAKALQERTDDLLASPSVIHELDVLADKLPDAPPTAPVRRGLWLTLAPKAGHEHDVAALLKEARSIVEAEPRTIAWFAVALDDGRYGIFDVFPDDRGRLRHLANRVPLELAKQALWLVGGVPHIGLPSVSATKLPE
jgi:quinol monooxygenase YgiN